MKGVFIEWPSVLRKVYRSSKLVSQRSKSILMLYVEYRQWMGKAPIRNQIIPLAWSGLMNAHKTRAFHPAHTNTPFSLLVAAWPAHLGSCMVLVGCSWVYSKIIEFRSLQQWNIIREKPGPIGSIIIQYGLLHHESAGARGILRCAGSCATVSGLSASTERDKP